MNHFLEMFPRLSSYCFNTKVEKAETKAEENTYDTAKEKFQEFKNKASFKKLTNVITLITVSLGLTSCLYKKSFAPGIFIIASLAARTFMSYVDKIPNQVELQEELCQAIQDNKLQEKLPLLIIRGLDCKNITITLKKEKTTLFAYLLHSNMPKELEFLISLYPKEKNNLLRQLLDVVKNVDQAKYLVKLGAEIKGQDKLLARFHTQNLVLSEETNEIIKYYTTEGAIDSTGLLSAILNKLLEKDDTALLKDFITTYLKMDIGELSTCQTYDSLKQKFAAKGIVLSNEMYKITPLCKAIYSSSRYFQHNSISKVLLKEMERQLEFSSFFYDDKKETVLFLTPHGFKQEHFSQYSNQSEHRIISNSEKKVLRFGYGDFGDVSVNFFSREFPRINELDPISNNKHQAQLQEKLYAFIQEDFKCSKESDSAVAKNIESLVKEGLIIDDIHLRFLFEKKDSTQRITFLQYCFKKKFYNTFSSLIRKYSPKKQQEKLLEAAIHANTVEEVKFLAELSVKLTNPNSSKPIDLTDCQDLPIYLAFLIKNTAIKSEWNTPQIIPQDILEFTKNMVKKEMKDRSITYNAIDLSTEIYKKENISLSSVLSDDNLGLVFDIKDEDLIHLNEKEIVNYFNSKGIAATGRHIEHFFQNSKRVIPFGFRFDYDYERSELPKELSAYGYFKERPHDTRPGRYFNTEFFLFNAYTLEKIEEKEGEKTKKITYHIKKGEEICLGFFREFSKERPDCFQLEKKAISVETTPSSWLSQLTGI